MSAIAHPQAQPDQPFHLKIDPYAGLIGRMDIHNQPTRLPGGRYDFSGYSAAQHYIIGKILRITQKRADGPLLCNRASPLKLVPAFQRSVPLDTRPAFGCCAVAQHPGLIGPPRWLLPVMAPILLLRLG